MLRYEGRRGKPLILCDELLKLKTALVILPSAAFFLKSSIIIPCRVRKSLIIHSRKPLFLSIHAIFSLGVRFAYSTNNVPLFVPEMFYFC